MSRIGKLPVEVPKGVSVTLGSTIAVKGPKGQLERPIVDGVSITQVGSQLQLQRASEDRQHRANHGLMRALVSNMVVGVTKGFERRLEIHGIGYKAELKGPKLVLSLGFSHPIEFVPPSGVSLAVDPKNTKITVSGIDREVVGQTAANLRSYRTPDHYKGKGVRYEGERVRLKAGKSAKK